MQPDLTCMTSEGPRNEWTNGSNLFGQLSNGYIFKVSCSDARRYCCRFFNYCRLLDKDCDILQAIGSQIPYECAIGLNGYVIEIIIFILLIGMGE